MHTHFANEIGEHFRLGPTSEATAKLCGAQKLQVTTHGGKKK
jgi:hypothetical protein